MRATIPLGQSTLPGPVPAPSSRTNRSRRLIEPLLNLAQSSDSLIADSLGPVVVRRVHYPLPRFIFMGPRGGGDTIRLAIFSGFEGDDDAGPKATLRFLSKLEREPALAKGYHIYAYPICNPSGFETRLKFNAAGRDLTRQFWNGSSQPEVYYLEREMGVHRFHGVITLSVAGEKLRLFVTGDRLSVLTKALASPIIPEGRIARAESPDGVAANAGFLTWTDELKPAPFEIDLRFAPVEDLGDQALSALASILDSYARLIAIQQYL